MRNVGVVGELRCEVGRQRRIERLELTIVDAGKPSRAAETLGRVAGGDAAEPREVASMSLQRAAMSSADASSIHIASSTTSSSGWPNATCSTPAAASRSRGAR